MQVIAGGDVTADFFLAEAVKTLDAIVTTATDEQSRKSYGNVVATLNRDSLAEKAAATNVDELLQGRRAGVYDLPRTSNCIARSPFTNFPAGNFCESIAESVMAESDVARRRLSNRGRRLRVRGSTR